MPHDPNSVVDYLGSLGQGSTFPARRNLWWRFNASEAYSGSGSQNGQLLAYLKFSDTTPDLVLEKSRFTSGETVFATVRYRGGASTVSLENELRQQVSEVRVGRRVSLGVVSRAGIYSLRIKAGLRVREMALVAIPRGNPLGSSFDIVVWDTCVDYTVDPPAIPSETGDADLLRRFFEALDDEAFANAFTPAAQNFTKELQWIGLGYDAFIGGLMTTIAPLSNSQMISLRTIGIPQFLDFGRVYFPLLIDEVDGVTDADRSRLKELLVNDAAAPSVGLNAKRVRDSDRICDRLLDVGTTGNVIVKKFELPPTEGGDVLVVGGIVRNSDTNSVSIVFQIANKVGGDLTFWKDLVSFRPSIDLQKSIVAHGTSWFVHPIEDGVANLNLDYYPVYVTQLPALDGVLLSAEKLLAHVRRNINSFVDNSITTFEPYKPADDTKWQSSDPLGAVMYLELFIPIPVVGGLASDSAIVLTSSSKPNEWRFSTVQGGRGITAALSRDNPAAHAVSGNRAFGFIDNGNGLYTFYTKGADRFTRFLDAFFFSPTLDIEIGFIVADLLWKSFQERIVAFINSHGGQASIKKARIVSERHDWDQIEAGGVIYNTTGQPGWFPHD